jgi:hypothetical protein
LKLQQGDTDRPDDGHSLRKNAQDRLALTVKKEDETYMRIILLVTVILGWFAYEVRAGDDIITSLSPKLRDYLGSHPPALQLLTNTYARAFSNRTVQLFYFYSGSKSIPGGYHYYSGESVVGIVVRENLPVLDEYLVLIFEMRNSESEKSFEETFRKARLGQISRKDFVEEILRVEFENAKKLKRLIRQIDFGKKEEAESHYHKTFLQCPEEYNDFLVYTKEVSKYDPVLHYQVKYESLQKN